MALNKGHNKVAEILRGGKNVSLHQFLCDNLFATKQCQRYSLADERLAVVLFGVYILLHYKYMVLELFQ